MYAPGPLDRDDDYITRREEILWVALGASGQSYKVIIVVPSGLGLKRIYREWLRLWNKLAQRITILDADIHDLPLTPEDWEDLEIAELNAIPGRQKTK